MSIKKLISSLQEKLVVKIICLTAAILVYVFHQVSILEKKSFTVPLEIESEGLLINQSTVPSFAKVTVRTSPDNISKISPHVIKAKLNLNTFTESGSYDVPLYLSLSPELLLLDPLEIQVKPEFLNVQLDEKIEKYVPVIPSVSGEVQHGYIIKNIEVAPSSVKIIGPKSIVEKTNYIYSGKVNVKGAGTGFTSKVTLDNINHLVTPVEEEPFKVTVYIAPAPSELSFKAIVPKVINLKEEFLMTSTIPPINFKLAGTVPLMEKFKFSPDNLLVDLSSVNESGRYELPVLFKLPQGISVKDKSYENVNIEIIKNPEFIAKEAENNNTATEESENNSENEGLEEKEAPSDKEPS